MLVSAFKMFCCLSLSYDSKLYIFGFESDRENKIFPDVTLGSVKIQWGFYRQNN